MICSLSEIKLLGKNYTQKDIQPVYSDTELWRKCTYEKRRKNMRIFPNCFEKSIN